MKRLLCIVIFLLFVTFSLTRCNILGGDLKALPYSFFASSEKIATDTMKKVVKAFDNRDKEMVKSLFAKEVLKKYKNFDKDLDKAFKYYTIKSEKLIMIGQAIQIVQKMAKPLHLQLEMQ